jgi:hypothetical protein
MESNRIENEYQQDVYVIDDTIAHLQWKFYDDTERYNEFYPVLKESYPNEIDIFKRINELNSLYNVPQTDTLLQSEIDTDKCPIPVQPLYNVDTFNFLLGYDWFIPIVNDTQVVYNENYANGNFISIRESVNYGDYDTLVQMTQPYTVQEDSIMLSTFKIPINKTVMRKDGTFRMAYSEEVNLIGICIAQPLLASINRNITNKTQFRHSIVALFDNDTIKRISEKTKRNVALVKERILINGLSVAIQYARSTLSSKTVTQSVYIDNELLVQRDQREAITMELNAKCGVSHNISLYSKYPYYGMPNDTLEQRVLWLKSQPDLGQLFYLIDYLESVDSSNQFIGTSLTNDASIQNLIENYCNGRCDDTTNRCELVKDTCTVSTKQEQYLELVKELFKSVAYTVRLIIDIKDAGKRIEHIVKERERRKDIINAIVRQNSLTVKDMTPKELEEYTNKQISKTIEYRKQFTKSPCKHYSLYNKFIKSDNTDDNVQLLNTLLSTYGGNTVNNTVQCKVCGFDMICEHYNVLDDLIQNPSNIAIIKKYNSFIIVNKDTNESICKHCGVIVAKDEIITDVMFDNETGQLKVGVILETRDQIRLNEQVQATLSLSGINGINSKYITKEISGTFVTAIKRINKIYKNDPEAKHNNTLLVYNGIIYGFLIHSIIKSNYTINFGVSFGVKDSNPVHALIKTVMKMIKTVDFPQFIIMDKLHLEKFIQYYFTHFKNQIVVVNVTKTEMSLSPSKTPNDIYSLFCYANLPIKLTDKPDKNSINDYISRIVNVYTKRRELYTKSGDTRLSDTERVSIENALKETTDETVTTDAINKVLRDAVAVIDDYNALYKLMQSVKKSTLIEVYNYLNDRAMLFMMKMSLIVRDNTLQYITTDDTSYTDNMGTVYRSSLITKAINSIIKRYSVLSLPKERIDKVSRHTLNSNGQHSPKYSTKEYNSDGVKYDFSIAVYKRNGKIYKEEPIIAPNSSIISSANNAGYRRVYNYYNYEQNENPDITIDKRCVNTGILYSDYIKQTIVPVSSDAVCKTQDGINAVNHFVYYCLDGVPHITQFEYTNNDGLLLFCKRCGQHFSNVSVDPVDAMAYKTDKCNKKLKITSLSNVGQSPNDHTVTNILNTKNSVYHISTERVDTNTVTEHLYKLSTSYTKSMSSVSGGKVNRRSKYNYNTDNTVITDSRYPISQLQFAIKFMEFGLLTKRMNEEITLVRNIVGDTDDVTYVKESISDYELMVRYNTKDRTKLQNVVRDKYNQNRIEQLTYVISKLQEHYNTLRNSDAYTVFKGIDTEYLMEFRGVSDILVPSTASVVSNIVSAMDLSLDQKCNGLLNLLISVIGFIIDEPKMSLFIIHFMKRQFDRIDLLDTTVAETQLSTELQEYKIKEKQSYILTMSMEQKKLLGMGYMSFEMQEREKIRWADQQALLDQSDDLLNVIDILEGNDVDNDQVKDVPIVINTEVDYGDIDNDPDDDFDAIREADD